MIIDLKKLSMIGVVVSSALILSACYHNKAKSTDQTSTTRQQQTQTQNLATSEAAEGVVIAVTDQGFSPAQMTVKSGGNLTYKNNSSKKVQIASDPHPTHTANSELTEGDFVLELEPGGSAGVSLTKVGTWGFHDHLNPGMRAKITVE